MSRCSERKTLIVFMLFIFKHRHCIQNMTIPLEVSHINAESTTDRQQLQCYTWLRVGTENKSAPINEVGVDVAETRWIQTFDRSRVIVIAWWNLTVCSVPRPFKLYFHLKYWHWPDYILFAIHVNCWLCIPHSVSSSLL